MVEIPIGKIEYGRKTKNKNLTFLISFTSILSLVFSFIAMTIIERFRKMKMPL